MTDLDPVTRTARDHFSIPYMYPWQRLVIANILDAVAAQATPADQLDEDTFLDEDGAERGRQIVLLPTGAGKSLCFQIPALMLDGPTLVVYPLLALMGDQLRSLSQRGIEPVLFRGGQSHEERERLFRALEGRDGKEAAKLIIANPEVLANEALLARIAKCRISHLAIDEAHCVAEWGDSFRPAYLELKQVIEQVGAPAVTAFTATASPPVLARIAEVLFGGRAHVVRGDSDRPNIIYAVNRCIAKDAALIREAGVCSRPAVIFCSTRGRTERIAALLRDTFDDTDVRYYHAGLLKDEKLAVEAWFHGHERAILVATCAWGMGIDKRDVRTVIHRDAPPSAEAYAQEAGRGGRDGSESRAILLWSPSDRLKFSRLKEKEKRRAEALIRFAESGQCRRDVLLKALGEERLAEETAGGERTLACAGCDVCQGTAASEERDGALVCEFIAKNRRCHSRAEIVDILHQAGNRISKNRHGYSGWRKPDFTAILEELEKNGKIRELKGWPWKGRITTVR